LAASKNIARQKIREGAVATSEDGIVWRKVESPAECSDLQPGSTKHLRLGKRFKRIGFGDPPSKSSSSSSSEDPS